VDAVGDRPDGRDDVVLVDAEGSSAARRGAARAAYAGAPAAFR
jgi:hypothetical protein